jgi:predicted ATP-binding protein involved in virulence
MKDLFITRITIHHVRHLKQLEITLSPDERKHLMLTGKNGSGKTSVLEAIRAAIAHGKRGKHEKNTLECEWNSLDGWREKLYKDDVVITYSRNANRFIAKDIFDQPLPPMFLQHLVNLQAEKAFARDEGDTETATRIEQWFTMFEHALQELFEDKTLTLRFDREHFTFAMIIKGRETFDFATLSDGYAAAINLLCDVMMSIGPKRGVSYEMQGVVFIDDLETCLDIDLQQRILPFFTRLFPKIQFIVSTHSPIVLNSLGGAVVYDLENRIRREFPLGHADKVLIGRYKNIGNYSDQIKRVIDEYESLLNKEAKTEKEEYRLFELRNYLTWIMHKLL